MRDQFLLISMALNDMIVIQMSVQYNRMFYSINIGYTIILNWHLSYDHIDRSHRNIESETDLKFMTKLIKIAYESQTNNGLIFDKK